MPLIPIHFFSEDIEFTLKQKLLVRSWIKDTILAEGYRLSELNYIFSSDNYLLELNKQYLNHDTYTDIITFDNSETPKLITGDIFISIDRVRENSSKFSVNEWDELHRVMIHGALHLLGYPDKGAVAKKLMTSRENHYLSLRSF
ncbi:rRNA maturation RNase YbeY [Flavihumibacter sp. R14]|nr:rRNA maturation RNase YbeY [Flavihumibacter soli]